MKKAIVLNAQGSKNWIGGLYYIKNIAFQLSLNEAIMKNYNLVVFVSADNYLIFSDLPENIKIEIVDFKNGVIGKIQKTIAFVRNNAAFVYPFAKALKIIGLQAISWIPDFQHYHYPENFSHEDLDRRERREQRIIELKQPLVLSSNDCLNDYINKHNIKKDNIYIVPFVSYIESELKKITIKKQQRILDKYHIYNYNYACISNQFWRHKNHILVLQAIKQLHTKLDSFKFVFTGLPKDTRDKEYYNEIHKLLNDPQVSEHIEVLGFIDRLEQITIMKNSQFIVQPSLFEGWGTVVEDAKVLDKTILLSDISIHREQMNTKCKLFDPHNAAHLANLILKEISLNHTDDVGKGVRDMYKRARKYSEEFERLLKEQEK